MSRVQMNGMKTETQEHQERIDTPPVGFYLNYKSWLSPLVGLVVAIPMLPLIGLLYLAVRLTSKGPGFYSQVRLGRNGKKFHIYKLRSMVVNAECGTGPVWAKKNDARVTAIGRILRDYHLDELPQILNVIKGDMCFVGPRPERPEIAAELAARIPRYYERLAVKPGVTGMAQIHLPPDSNTRSVCRKLSYDLAYLVRGSFWLDVRVILATGFKLVPFADKLTKQLGSCAEFIKHAGELFRPYHERLAFSGE